MPEVPLSPVERHCRRLLLAYPAAYRAQRGEELIATMLDAAPPGRRPTLADQLDVVAAGLRRRLGTVRIAGLDAGLLRAAPVALALAAGISAFLCWRVEPAVAGGTRLFGVFRTLGPIAYACWVLATIGWATLRPAIGRVLISVAVAVTLALPLVAPLTTVDRPPLWVVMAMSAFGLLALLGTAPAVGATRPTLDEGLAVVTGAAAVAMCAWLVTLAWPATVPGYYQPTLARVSLVVTAAVAAVAAVAVLRRGRREWLWATALLGVPVGWIGPYASVGLVPTEPRVGRLAQVVLASCAAVAALAWLSRRRAPRLPAAGAGALGTAVGLLAFALLARAGRVGFTPGPVPTYVWYGLGALFAAGLLAGGMFHSGVLIWAPAAFAGAFAVATYDHDWTVGGWPGPGTSLNLAMALALPPLAACVYAAAAHRWSSRGVSIRRLGVLVVSAGWIGYVALPHVHSWGPIILVLLACGLALHLSGTRLGHPRPTQG
jgi:hypothetical protein